MVAHHPHGLAGRRAHGGKAEALGELAQNALRRLAGLDDARRDAERPGRGRDEEGVGLGLMAGEIGLAELVLDEPVGGGGIRHPQQGLGQHHEGQAFLGGERVFPQHLLDAAEPAALGADRLDQAGGLRVHALLPLRREPRAGEKPGRNGLVVLGIGRVEGQGGAGGRAHRKILWMFPEI